MNKTTSHQNTVYPQTVEIPEPLEVHPSISPLAAELLMKTAEILATQPGRYNQDNGVPHCGSPCCIMGHCLLLAGKSGFMRKDEAAAFTGLSMAQFMGLYYAEDWPKACAARDIDSVSAAEGIARINHFLSTGQ